MFMKPLLATLLIGIAAVLLSMAAPSAACGCIEPMPDSELSTLILQANRGNIEAPGQIWNEYHSIREDRRNAEIWRKRAIAVGSPRAMKNMAHDWMWKTQREPNFAKKRIFLKAAIALLGNGYRNRALLGHASPSWDDRYFYVSSMREAQAALVVANDGVDGWRKRAEKGDAFAAYHVAIYYFWVNLDQDRRTYWETQASVFGEPHFAGQSVDHSRTDAQNEVDVRHALRRRDLILRVGDRWMQSVTTVDLQNRLNSLIERRRRNQKS
jgi:hypothetical protein